MATGLLPELLDISRTQALKRNRRNTTCRHKGQLASHHISQHTRTQHWRDCCMRRAVSISVPPVSVGFEKKTGGDGKGLLTNNYKECKWEHEKGGCGLRWERGRGWNSCIARRTVNASVGEGVGKKTRGLGMEFLHCLRLCAPSLSTLII
jgi:hypothetical protein